MDFVKNAMGGNKDGASKTNEGGAQSQDYVDKGTAHSLPQIGYTLDLVTDLY